MSKIKGCSDLESFEAGLTKAKSNNNRKKKIGRLCLVIEFEDNGPPPYFVG